MQSKFHKLRYDDEALVLQLLQVQAKTFLRSNGMASVATTKIKNGTERAANIVAWVIQVPLSAAFVLAGVAKLTGNPMMAQVFQTIGTGQWLRYLTGVLELAGALLLLTPSLSALGAVLLSCIMVGAVIAHLTVLDTSPLAPLVLLVLALVVVWLRRSQIVKLPDL
jgi:putative oxidoreductase